ncbi:unnamed protein product [Tetraodon nigroviridis]|uniref:(spotted green pufferfish) hypothetical protein n=1 Tax=Tetraodon nigroviridis TaxID=99883 RepID=Q4T1L9_TETNG|nr:unnamed protein product [Tetraodon nigroviridis]
MDPGPGPWNSALPVIRPSLRAQCLLGFGSRRPVTRRERVMVPPEKKDATYMSNRLKNNEAARRSREKRRLKDLLLEGQLLALSEENAHLRNEVLGLRYLSMCARKDTPASAGLEVLIQLLQAAACSPPVRLGFLLLWQGWRGQGSRTWMLRGRSPSALPLKRTPFCPGLTRSILAPSFLTGPQPGWCPARQWTVVLLSRGCPPCWLPRPPTPACLSACRRPSEGVQEPPQRRTDASFRLIRRKLHLIFFLIWKIANYL